jgi:hypothetical protein
LALIRILQSPGGYLMVALPLVGFVCHRDLEGCVVECPWHAAQWDVRTGEALTALATADIPLFEVRVVDDDIEIKLTEAVLAQSSPGTSAP